MWNISLSNYISAEELRLTIIEQYEEMFTRRMKYDDLFILKAWKKALGLGNVSTLG